MPCRKLSQEKDGAVGGGVGAPGDDGCQPSAEASTNNYVRPEGQNVGNVCIYYCIGYYCIHGMFEMESKSMVRLLCPGVVYHR